MENKAFEGIDNLSPDAFPKELEDPKVPIKEVLFLREQYNKNTIEIDNMKSDLRARKYIIIFLIGLIVIMYFHFVWHIELFGSCPVGGNVGPDC